MEEKIVETKTFKFDAKEISRKVLGNWTIENLKVKEYWNSHGRLIDCDKTNTYSNAKVKIERVVTSIFGTNFEGDELFINGKRYECMDVVDFKGTTGNALIKVTIGEG